MTAHQRRRLRRLRYAPAALLGALVGWAWAKREHRRPRTPQRTP